MNITSYLFEAYLECPTKCFLRSAGETGYGNVYADWMRAENEMYRKAGVKRLMGKYSQDEHIIRSPETSEPKLAQWRLAVDFMARSHDMESTIHAIERIPSGDLEKPAQFIPIRFIFNNNFTRNDKLLLAFDALVVSEMLGSEVGTGKIVYGDDYTMFKVKVSILLGDLRKQIGKIATLLSITSSPDLILNRHCAECEFKVRCREKAIEADDISLLSGVSEKERKRQHNNGIFTVTQFSYTFRPRRTSKRARNPAKPHYLALQALAIRENKVYIHGNPQFSESKARVYLDIEGLPDSAFYYLIGALVVFGKQETFHTFWADEKSDEARIFTQFAELILQLPDAQIIHYGTYEATALKRIRQRLLEPLHPKIDDILKRAINVLSIVHPHIYFPTYSNGLKDIGKFLGYERTHDDGAAGLQTIVWRKEWEINRSSVLKADLLRYNEDDCRMLKHLCKFIGRLSYPDESNLVNLNVPVIIRTEEMIKERPHWQLFHAREYTLEDFKHVVKCSYFDYQREKVFIRTHGQFSVINRQKRKFRKTKIRPNKTIKIECQRCPKCQEKSIKIIKQISRPMIDLKFSKTGVKKWITKFNFYRYRCQKCDRVFNSVESTPGGRFQYGHALMSWCVYSGLFCGMNMNRARIALGDTFEIFAGEELMLRSKHLLAAAYEGLYNTILQNLLQEKCIHIDETTVKLKGINGYVWVLTGMDKAYYFFKPSRESTFLKDMSILSRVYWYQISTLGMIPFPFSNKSV